MAFRSNLWRVILALALLVFLADAIRYAGHQLDDTFISFRYARNLVEGQGLVFNAGERVEGYTNLLFVLLATALLRAGADPLAGMSLISAASALALLWVTARLERKGSGGGDRRIPVSLCLLLLAEGFAYWSVIAMETLTFALLLAAALLLQIRESERGRGHASALAFMVLALTRPEGAYCFAVATAAGIFLEWRASGTWRHLRRLAVNGVLFAAGFGSLMAWRLWYYGGLVPNTFHAKVTGGMGQLRTGAAYLADWALASPILAATLLVPLLLLVPTVRARLRGAVPFWLVYSVTVAFTLYIVLVGGDSMPHFRFFAQVLPLFCLLAAWTLGALEGPAIQAGTLRNLVLVLVLAGHGILSHATIQPYRAFVAHRTAVVGAAVGRWFGESLEPGSLMAINTVGALPWESRLPTLDMLGLTDASIANRPIYVSSAGWAGHRRGWGAYVLDRRPRVILWYNSAGSTDPFYLGDRELADDPFFRFFYRHRVERLPALGDGSAPDRIIARFLGHPFGFHESGSSVAPELGLRARFHRGGPIRYTAFQENRIVVHYFEEDPRDRPLRDLGDTFSQDLDGFLDAVTTRWKADRLSDPPPDPAALSEVEALCARAQDEVESGDLDAARRTLTEAARRNGAARSPLVYQYMANVAVLIGDLLAAVPAQKEALRLAPGNPLYLANLKRLLARPFHGGAEDVAPQP